MDDPRIKSLEEICLEKLAAEVVRQAGRFPSIPPIEKVEYRPGFGGGVRATIHLLSRSGTRYQAPFDLTQKQFIMDEPRREAVRKQVDHMADPTSLRPTWGDPIAGANHHF